MSAPAALLSAVTGLGSIAGIRLAIARLAAGRRPRLPVLTGGLVLLLTAGYAAQLCWPDLLPRFERNAGAIAQGQVWRLFTSLWLQDGGRAGAFWNILGLAVIGGAAEQRLAQPRWLAVYFASALAGGIAGLWWQPVGAGNSIATLGLAGALFAAGTRARDAWAWPLSLAGLALAAVTATLHDLHGIAILTGAAVGAQSERSTPP